MAELKLQNPFVGLDISWIHVPGAAVQRDVQQFNAQLRALRAKARA
jgi:hypothetical protein